MSSKRFFAVALLSGFVALLTMGLSGCGTSAPAPIVVTLTPSSAQSIDQAQTVSNIAATVKNDSKTAGVMWTLSGTGCTGAACGAFSAQSTTTATYLAPSPVTTAFTATVTATSISDPTKSATLTINVNPLPEITTTQAEVPTATAGSPYSFTLTESFGTAPFTWTSAPTGGDERRPQERRSRVRPLVAQTLPYGLSLNSSTGAITGTPTGGGSGSYTFTVTDATGESASQALTITVNPPPPLGITTSSLANGVVAAFYSQTLQATGGIKAYTWSYTGNLPTGLTLNTSTGAITGTPTASGTFNFTAEVTDSETPTPQSVTANLSITIIPQLLITTSGSLPPGVVNVQYSGATLQATGGVTSYTWSWSGNVPTGLSLNASTGAITGTPTTAGTYNFTAKVTDSGNPQQTATANLSITVNPPLAITPPTLATGVVGSAYSQTLQATGGILPYTWSYTGNLPPGLGLSVSGAITGTPTTTGTFNFTAKVTDSETPPQSVTANLSITVNPQLAIATNSLNSGVVGTFYSQTLQATGGITPYTWSYTGSLPTGLTLNTSTGAITGTPSAPGTFNFTAKVTDSEAPAQSATANLSITINAQLAITTSGSLPPGVINVAYSGATLQATGGVLPYTWSWSGNTPTGLSLNASSGAITGTPTATGMFSFTAKVTDSGNPQQMATANLSITVNPPLAIMTTTLANGVVGTSYNQTLQATGGITPYTWSYTGNLPTGLSLNSSTGAITGTPTAAGTFNFTAKVTDSESPTQSVTANLSITIIAQLVLQTSGSLPQGVINMPYSGATLQATGGVLPYTWSWSGSVPPGLSLNASNGAITGTPTAAGTFNFTAKVTDSGNPQQMATSNLTIVINGALTITTTSLQPGVINQAYSQPVQATGGITPYTWSYTGTLPTGLGLNTTTGVISGTPTVLGPFSFTVKVTDSESPTQSATANLSIQINNSAPLSITTTGLPQGVVNTPYQNAMLQATGGVQPYTWSITSGSLPTGLNLNTSSGAITGTPTVTGNFPITFKVTDSTQPTPETATASLPITINSALTITTTSVPNGTVNASYSATISASGGITPYSWSIINGSLPPGLNPSNSNNNLIISGTPTTTGNYTFTAQVTDNENPQVSVTQGFTIVIGTLPTGYTVSGTVSYSGSKTGWIYLQLYSNNGCGNCNNNLGTSISKAGAFTIHGVQPGTYTLQAFMDNLNPAFGTQNASNPTGSFSPVTVVSSNVSGVPLTLTDPGAVTLSSGPQWNPSNGLGAFSAGGTTGGAFVSFQSITNNNGIELPTSYTLEWSTNSSFSGTVGSMSLPATGGNNPWIVTGLTNGQSYYFRAQGVAGSSTSSWVESPSAILIGAPSGGNAISGTVSFTGTATGPLYVGFYEQSSGNIYAEQVGSKSSPPKSPASYSISVPDGTFYFFGVLDQNNTGLTGVPGEISNVNENNIIPVTISGPNNNENLTLPNANSVAFIRTQVQEQINGGTSINYTLGFNVDGLFKLPVAVEITSETNPDVVVPSDLATGGFSGNSDRFSYYTSTNGFTPQVGDTYTLNVTYADGTSDTWKPVVTAVLNDAFVTDLIPQGSGISVTPNFSWTDPGNPSNYLYQFSLCCDSQGTIWQIPSNNSNSKGFPYTITSITWDVDPTGSGDLPNESSLAGSTNFNWQIQASDVNGNSAQVVVFFTTMPTPLMLQAGGALPSGTVGQSYNAGINASGGTPGYTFYLNNGTQQVPTDGSQYAIADGIWVSSNGGSTLAVGGTPGSPGTVTIPNVTVMDSLGNTAGPDTYIIAVSTAQPLAITTTSLPGGNNGWLYSANVKATGGVTPYTWSISSGSLPNGLSIGSNGGNDGIISGTPTVNGNPSFTVKVTDNIGETATQTLSIAITNCTFTLNGNYAFLLNGWKSNNNSAEAQSTVGSFVANTSGNITSGEVDINNQSKGPQNATLTGGSYCVNSSSNLALISLTASGQSGGSALFAAVLDSTGSGHITRYDNTSSEISSGLLRKQNTDAFKNSALNGNYAFGLVGADSGDNRFAVAGVMNLDGNGNVCKAGSITCDYDYNDGGSGAGTGTISPSTYSVASNGRGTATIIDTNGTFNMVFYVVSASEFLMMEDDATGSNIEAGQVLQQSSGSFTDASLNAVSVLEDQGLDTNNSPATVVAEAGLFTPNGSGSFSVSTDQDDGGTLQTQSGSGTYSVASNGRVTTSGTGSHNPVFYLIAKNQAFILGTGSKANLGTLTPQTGSNFTNSSLSGNYYGGSQQPVTYDVSSEVDTVNLSYPNLTGTSDDNSNCGNGSVCPNSKIISGTYSVSPNGRVVITSGTGGNGAILYIINDTSGSGQFVVLSPDTDPALIDFHQ